MLKRTMLVGVMALAAVACAAPAAQGNAPEWFHDGVRVGEGEGNGKTLHVEGEISSTTLGGGGLITGPCEVTFGGFAWNENGMADGVITGGTIQEHCEANVSGCTFTPTLQNFPWDLTGITVTEKAGLEIIGAQFEFHYSAGCPVPVSTIMATGTITGIVEADARCLDFDGHTDSMLTHAPLPTLTKDVLGTICDTTLELG